jgi:hypothetical protein
MNQALYAHMNNKRKMKKKIKLINIQVSKLISLFSLGKMGRHFDELIAG